MKIKQSIVESLKILALLALIFGLFPVNAHAQLVCSKVLTQSPAQAQSQNNKNKYEKLAEELGLTYLKSPVPAGYQRVLLGSRTYTKKDGSPGKTVFYYRYLRPDGSTIRPRLDSEEYKNIKLKFGSFSLDPKFKNVWLSTDENTHIQVLAKNDQDKTIAIYHEDWESGAAVAKFKRVQEFGRKVPALREQLMSTLSNPQLTSASKEKVEATALLLLMSGRIRVGDIKYLNEYGTTGVTTLEKDQLFTDTDGKVYLKYIGKSGNKNPEKPTITIIQIMDPLLRQSLLELQQANPDDSRLLIYERNANSVAALTPEYLNERLRNLISGKAHNSVKDLRTWAATVKTVEELIASGPPPQSPTAKDKVLMAVSKRVSLLLNNTPGVARKNYIDPRILNPDSFEKLWSFCQRKYPNLIGLNSSTNLYNINFEKLANEFLDWLDNQSS